MKTIKLFLLTFLFSFTVMVQAADAKLSRFTVEGVVGPDVPKCPIGSPYDSALYAPLDNIFSEGDLMKMTFTVDMSKSCDFHKESVPAGDPDGGNTCYYNGSVVALTLEVGGYRFDYGKADPYLYPTKALTYDPVNFGYTEDLFQYIKVHDEKWSPDSNNCAGETVDHLMLEQRLMFGTGDDLTLTGIDYYDGDLAGKKYTYKVTGCSFAITGENATMFDDTSLPAGPVPVDTNDPQIYLCRWALLFGRLDKIEAGIQAPYKLQGKLTGYNVKSAPDTDSDNSNCFIATADYGSTHAPQVKILREFRDQFLLTNQAGPLLKSDYYRYSPPFSILLTETDNLQTLTRICLLPGLGVSWVALQLGTLTPAIMIFFGIGLIGLAGFRYLLK